MVEHPHEDEFAQDDERRPSFYPADEEVSGFMKMAGDWRPGSKKELEEWIEKRGFPDGLDLDLVLSIDDSVLENYGVSG